MIRTKYAKPIMCIVSLSALFWHTGVLAQNSAQDSAQESTQVNTQDNMPASTIRGVVQSVSKIEIRTDLSVPVIEAKFRKGMAFQKNDVLITFDCARFHAERAAASASANAATIELKQKRTLLKHGAAGKGDVDLASAAMAKSLAERDVIDQRMKECTITAPFNGRVVATTANAFEMPKPGEPLLVIIDDTNLEVELVMPSDYLAQVKLESSFSFAIDETGETVHGTVVRFGAEVDPVSQTIEVIGRFHVQSPSIRSGMSGAIAFDTVARGGT